MPSTSDGETNVLRCPVCRKPAADAYRPFCSKRCADIDLGKWLSGSYAIAGRDDEEDGEGAGLDRDSKDVDET